MTSRTKLATVGLVASALSLVLAGCGGVEPGNGADDGKVTHVAGAPDWCGTKKISFALLDGFGGNSWRLVTTASGKDEAAKCPSVTEFKYADGQGNMQKAISDIKGMVSTGVDAMVVFPDAGQGGAARADRRLQGRRRDGALPRRPRWQGRRELRRVDRRRLRQRRRQLGELDQGERARTAATSCSWAARPATARAPREYDALRKTLPDSYKFIGQTPFRRTNWDPTKTQQLLTADIAKNPQIDVIVSDFGPTLVSSLPLFPKSGRDDPGAGHLRRQLAELLLEGQPGGEPLQDDDRRHRQRQRPPRGAVAVAKATGGKVPTEDSFKAPVFEDSVSGQPNAGDQCDANLPGDVYLSAQMPGDGAGEARDSSPAPVRDVLLRTVGSGEASPDPTGSAAAGAQTKRKTVIKTDAPDTTTGRSRWRASPRASRASPR